MVRGIRRFPIGQTSSGRKQWARIDPALAEFDLRPYVFVTRDRRSVFGVATSLGELDELLTKLQGPPLLVRQASAAVSRLQSSDAEQLFEALRGKMAATEDLMEEPSGARGLAEITRHHQFLQPALLSLLKQLPASRLGPWAVGGWTGAFTESSVKTDFNALLSEWAAQEDNKTLQTAARAAAQLGRKRGRN